MCGRFAIFTKPHDYLDQIGLAGQVTPCVAIDNYNAYPTQDLPVLYHNQSHQLSCDLLHWGLIPSWAKDASIGNKTSNARSETAAEKPSFRHAFKSQRCLVPVDGWYEWKRAGKNKQPYFHHRADHKVIWLAGLWEHWINPENDKPLLSFSILTRDAVGNAANIHDRMPVCITPNKAELWLNPHLQERQGIEILMKDNPKQDYEIYPVTEKMNSPKFHGAECIQTMT